jgi:hypothetical protein
MHMYPIIRWLSGGFVAGAFPLFGTLSRVWNAVYILSYKGLLNNY